MRYIFILLMLSSFASKAQPANDNPCGAINIPVQALTCTPTTIYNYFAATSSSTLPLPTCAWAGGNADIWFSFTATLSGTYKISTASGGGGTNYAAALYSASACGGTFTELGCNDDFAGLFPELTIAGLTAGSIYYLRLWQVDPAQTIGGVKICVANTVESLSTAFTGIGTVYPSSVLDVNGNIKIRGGNPGAGKLLTSGANGEASWQTPIVPANTIQTIGSYTGPIGTLPAVANALEFAGPIHSITLNGNQRVIMNATLSLGRNTTGNTYFFLDAGFQLIPGGTIFNSSGSNNNFLIFSPAFTAASRYSFTVTGTFKPPAGTYRIGPILQCPTASYLNFNDFMNCTYTVINE